MFAHRCHPKCDVFHHFDQDAAKAERDHFAEARIGDCADHDFLAAFEHLLHLNTLYTGVLFITLGVLDEPIEGAFDICAVFNADDHAAGFGLV